MIKEIKPPSDDDICRQAAAFANLIYSFQDRGQGTELNNARRQWVLFLKGLGKNSRRTTARNAYWEAHDKLTSDG